MWEVTAAVIATALGIVVLPFITALISNWLEARRAERSRRMKLFEELATNGANGTTRDSTVRQNELHATIRALMGPRDDAVRKATRKAFTYAATPEEDAVLRAWAFGQTVYARRLAKRLLSGQAARPAEQRDQ